jgi:hypothetical protein
LHEARTKDGWRVWARGRDERVIDGEKRIVYRDTFQTALDMFIEWYGETLKSDATLQAAFIRKFDDLCAQRHDP